MIHEHDDFEANSSVVLLTTFVFYIVLLCVLRTKSTAGDEAIPLYSPVAGSGSIRCGPVGPVWSSAVRYRCGPVRLIVRPRYITTTLQTPFYPTRPSRKVKTTLPNSGLL